MFFPEGQVRVFVYGEPVSMRLSFDGLGDDNAFHLEQVSHPSVTRCTPPHAHTGALSRDLRFRQT